MLNRFLPFVGALALASSSLGAPAVNFTSHTSGAPGGFGAALLSWEFDALGDIALTELSIFDENGDGLAVDHRVGVFSRATGLLLVETTLAAGSGETLDGFFRTKSVAPTLLLAGQRYVVVGDRGAEENFLAPFQVHTLGGYTVDPAILPKPGGGSYSSTGFAITPEVDTSYDFYFGPNLTVTPVPEPASMLALALGVGAVVVRRRKNRS